MAQMVKNPLAIQETWVQSLNQEDPLEKGMATHTRILAWRIPWAEKPGRLQSMGSQKSQTQLRTNAFTFYLFGGISQSYLKCCLQGHSPPFALSKT